MVRSASENGSSIAIQNKFITFQLHVYMTSPYSEGIALILEKNETKYGLVLVHAFLETFPTYPCFCFER